MQTGFNTNGPVNCEINPTRNGKSAPPDDPNAVMIVKDTTWIFRGSILAAKVIMSGYVGPMKTPALETNTPAAMA